MKRYARLALALGAVALSGCEPGFFRAQGTVASEGSRINRWTARPQGCTRDPFDGQPAGRTSSILTLLWEDPLIRNDLDNRDLSADAPLRLEFSRAPAGSPEPVVATLETKREAGMPLNASDCRRLSLQVRERAPHGVESRPTLAGHVQLDCRLKTGHVTADVQFSECSY